MLSAKKKWREWLGEIASAIGDGDTGILSKMLSETASRPDLSEVRSIIGSAILSTGKS